jgi:hypothetical protein
MIAHLLYNTEAESMDEAHHENRSAVSRPTLRKSDRGFCARGSYVVEGFPEGGEDAVGRPV